jgi:hypothetical protein
MSDLLPNGEPTGRDVDAQAQAEARNKRATLIANLCALLVACIVVAEARYIVHAELEFDRPFDIWAPFVPALTMFVVRRKTFSYCFLFLYVALAIELLFQARTIYLGTYKWAGEKEPVGYVGLFFLISIVSLGIYVAGAAILFVVSLFESRR